MITAESPRNSERASVFALMSMTSSDSGVVIRRCAGSVRKDFFRESDTSPCHLNTSRPTMRAYPRRRSSWLLSRARMGQRYSAATGARLSVKTRESNGNTAASVFPPAVGASTMVLSPSRTASIVSS